MAGLEQLRKKITPLIDVGSSDASSASYEVTDAGSLNLLSGSCVQYNINELGLQKRYSLPTDAFDGEGLREKTYKCASHEMCVFGAIGFGASSVVRIGIHNPTHRILALKRINIFEKDKRQQLLNEIRTLCEAPQMKGLVEFYGAFYSPESGQICIALEYMNAGSLADILRIKSVIPESVLAVITSKVLSGLRFLHAERHLVHRDIKPANLLINLNGEPKITDFGISAGLDNSIAMCASFVGTVTYMSPERCRNTLYSYPADVWSLGLSLLECATGQFPYNAEKGPVTLMVQVIEDPSPSLPDGPFSPEFRSFVDSCLRKDPRTRPTAEQLLVHPFIKKYESMDVDLAGYVRSVFDPTDRLKDMADMLTTHYYMLFDGPEKTWEHMRSLYRPTSSLCLGSQVVNGDAIFECLTSIRSALAEAGDRPEERLVHNIEDLQCSGFVTLGVRIKVSGFLALGHHFVPTCEGVQVEGIPTMEIEKQRMGSFSDQFVFEPGESSGSFFISKQEIVIQPPSWNHTNGHSV